MFDWPSAYSGNYSFEVAITEDMAMPVDVCTSFLARFASLVVVTVVTAVALVQTNLFYHIMGLALKWGMVEYEQASGALS